MGGTMLRPGTDALLRAWKGTIETDASGPGFDIRENRQTRFRSRVDAFLESPSREAFEDLWSDDVVVASDNPGPDLLLTTFDGDVADLGQFLVSLRSAEEFDPGWMDMLGWNWALWELYTRLDDDVPVILTEEAVEALEWLGLAVGGTFRERMRTVDSFVDRYARVAGHPTAGTPHEVPVRVELEQLFRTMTTLRPRDIAPQLKGPHGEFYRHLYGGREVQSDRTDQVRLVDETPIVYAYAWGKSNRAYERQDRPSYWGGNHWESWKEEYASYFEETVRGRYALTDLEPGEVKPLFDHITKRDATALSSSVAEYLMGGRWGQYVWDDVVDYFVSNPNEASNVLSTFFDDSSSASTRLQAFREHTIHISNEEGRSPGSIERMATSLLMLAFPKDHVGLPPRKTAVLMEEKSTLPKYRSGFRPQQYAVVVYALRALRDEIRRALRELGADDDVTMLDIHNVLWIYENAGDPARDQLPPEKR